MGPMLILPNITVVINCNVICIEGRYHQLLLTMSFILCVLCDHDSISIYTVITIYTSALCTDGVTIFICPCMPYRTNVYAYVLCI